MYPSSYLIAYFVIYNGGAGEQDGQALLRPVLAQGTHPLNHELAARTLRTASANPAPPSRCPFHISSSTGR